MPVNNIFELGELFEQVQLRKIFPDGKTFVDCIPQKDISAIRNLYESEKNLPGFDLSEFVHRYFKEPSIDVLEYKSEVGLPLKKHLEELWGFLTRQPVQNAGDSLIALPGQYIVPGGRFREIYYWDSFFTMLGLRVSGRTTMIGNMLDNFSYLIDQLGYIPNGNRTYYLGRSQPPFFACMVQLLAEVEGNEILLRYLPQLEKEYDFWMKGTDKLSENNISANRVVRLSDDITLNRYWDDNDTPRPESFREDVESAATQTDKKTIYRHLRAGAESGWDFSSRWFADGMHLSTIHTTDIIPVDLNCLLYHLEQTIAEACRLSGDIKKYHRYIAASDTRKTAINKYCWSSGKEFYYDFDITQNSITDCESLAATFPLYFNIASFKQAKAVANKIEKKFLRNGGLITTTQQTTQQWDAPNGWAPLQWIAIIGLKNYGFDELTKMIALRWLRLNEKVYHNTGKMMEKYNVVDTNLLAGGGEYESQDGFGWTNGVYLALEKMLGEV